MSITETITDTITSTTKALPEWSLTTLKSSNDAIIAATKRVAEAFEPATGLLPAGLIPTDQLPEPSDVVSQWFSYAEKVMAEQKRLALTLIGAAPKAPAKSTPKATKTA